MMFYWNWMFVILVLMNQEAVSENNCTGNIIWNAGIHNLQVQNRSDTSITVSWQAAPKLDCVSVYIVFIKNSTGNSLLLDWTHHTTYEFINLRQCEVYKIYVDPRPYNIGIPLVTKTTAPDNVVVDLQMNAGWNNLQLTWTLPEIYRKCVSEYVVQVCRNTSKRPLDCLAWLTVHDMTYSVSNLSVCTLYTASVIVKLSETRLSLKKSTVTELTRSEEPLKSTQFVVVNVTANIVVLEWKVLNMPPACAKKLVLSTLSRNGSIIAEKELDYTQMKYTVLDLKPCQSYLFKLKVVDEHAAVRVEYKDITVVTQPSDIIVSNLTLGRVSPYSLHLKWFLSEELSACVSDYLVTFIRTDNTTVENKTPVKNITWSNESICGLDSVSVQILSKGKLWGVPAIIDIRRRYEDVTLLSFKVNKTANRSVEVVLTSVSFICVTHYEISWHSPSSPNISSPLTMFNRSVSTSDLLPCTEYKAVVQPWNGRFKLQAITRNVTTEQEECPTSAVPIIVGLIVLAIVITSVLSFIGWRKWREEERYTTIKRKSKLKKNKTSELFEGLTLEQFLQHSENVLSSPDQLKAEFDILESENHEYPHVIGILDHNKAKNRYYNIIPYDLTRVILEGDYENDYINASHVKLQEARSVNYLACQSPKAGTCGDFWKMIFQYRVKIVVMISMPDEIDKKKGFIYYPRLEEVVMHDNIVIACRKEEDFSNYIVRSLVADKAGVVLNIKQFHFVGWPEFGVPESPDVMVRFVDAVQNVSKGKIHYMAVLCSAGAGRTGTFIALDALMRLIRQKWNCKFNILDIVHKMRQQRCKMVQTVGQYKYIYECMKYALENHRSTFVKVRMNLYKRSKNERRLEGSDSNDVIHLEDLSRPQTSVVT